MISDDELELEVTRDDDFVEAVHVHIHTERVSVRLPPRNAVFVLLTHAPQLGARRLVGISENISQLSCMTGLRVSVCVFVVVVLV